MDDNRLIKRIFKYIIGLRRKTKWVEEVKKDAEEIKITPELILNRKKFRTRVGDHKLHEKLRKNSQQAVYVSCDLSSALSADDLLFWFYPHLFLIPLPYCFLQRLYNLVFLPFQFVVFAALVAVARAGILGAPAVYAPGAPLAAHGYAAPALAHGPVAYAAGPAVAKVAAAVDTDYDPNPQYSYAYDIQDALTGDSKGQQESRSGDVVQGSYSLVEPDGTRRTVEYTADPVNGFNAVVHREPAVAAVAKVAAPVAKVAAPALAYGHGLGAPALAYGHGLAAPALAYGHGKAFIG
ncbi:cuticle protein 21-like [Anabrus simplex]|uniref:cuticle protein 21-like n=1 Tax=Anabrus simplex TaxID=316456 RepID=UPI0035A2FBEA